MVESDVKYRDRTVNRKDIRNYREIAILFTSAKLFSVIVTHKLSPPDNQIDVYTDFSKAFDMIDHASEKTLEYFLGFFQTPGMALIISH